MGYKLPFYKDEPYDATDTTKYVAQDYTLCYGLNVNTNHDVDDLLTDHLTNFNPELLTEITFDSEAGCFFAYTNTKTTMLKLSKIIADLIAKGPDPTYTPGDITNSPAYIRTR